MTLSMYQLAVPPFVQGLSAMSVVLAKADAFAAGKKVEPAVLLAARLAPDMFPLSRQVQIACDFAKSTAARLAGIEVPSWKDDEKTIADLRSRVAKTLDYVRSFKAGQIDGSEVRDVAITLAGKPVTFKGQPYLVHFVLPNFYFHCTVAYAILRHNGVELGKRDFMGPVPGLSEQLADRQ
jgi:uncharacterized protein